MSWRKPTALAAALALCVTLGGCAAGEETSLCAYSQETAVYEGADYRLTYPACFSLVKDTGKMAYFAVEGENMAFTLTAEENPYGERDIADYPEWMGIYTGVEFLREDAFGVEKYQPGILSGYYLYTFINNKIYLIEYNYAGEEAQRALQSLFRVEAAG